MSSISSVGRNNAYIDSTSNNNECDRDAYSCALLNVADLIVMNNFDYLDLCVLQKLCFGRGNNRPVAVPSSNLPAEIRELLHKAGMLDFIIDNVDEVVFIYAEGGGFVGNMRSIYDDKIIPGRRLVFVDLPLTHSQLDPLEVFLTLIHEAQHRATIIAVYNGREPACNLEQPCIFEKLAEEKEIETIKKLLNQNNKNQFLSIEQLDWLNERISGCKRDIEIYETCD